MTKNNTTTISVKGMTCTNCKNKIMTELKKLSGVKKVQVDLIDDTATVIYNSSKTTKQELNSAIKTAGYNTGLSKKHKTIIEGLTYGLMPHIGCIAFIIGSILGVTVLMQFFKPLLMNRYFFHFLILLSIGFATLSSALYLRKNGFLSVKGIRKKWKYLSTMYGTTIGINLILFMLIFPLLANVSVSATSANSITGNAVLDSQSASTITIAVDIPCPGHAPLISEELKTINGVQSIKFKFPNKFNVAYNSALTSKEQMLSLEVFDEYPATVLEEQSNSGGLRQVDSQQPTANSGGTCGATAGSCGCTG
ncbi:hypothetical protein GOV04_04305 [Candidatus Woesearchaeota archaeon]|nr:hypothetical protein [Candidatus Woesearchaeota archaeon]